MMRQFESFLDRKIKDGKEIIFIDLAYAEKTRGIIEITLGLKIKFGGLIGTAWNTSQLIVEDEFTIEEFKSVCGRFGIQCSAFSGDSESYILA